MDRVLEEAIKLLSEDVDQCVQDDSRLERKQPLVSQMINSVSSHTSNDHIPQLQEFISKCVNVSCNLVSYRLVCNALRLCREKQIATGLIARSMQTEHKSEQLLSADAARVAAELHVSNCNSGDAVAKLRLAEQAIKASLAACRNAANTRRQSSAVSNLKASIAHLFKCMKDRASLHRYGQNSGHAQSFA